jgi:hypothetical protein
MVFSRRSCSTRSPVLLELQFLLLSTPLLSFIPFLGAAFLLSLAMRFDPPQFLFAPYLRFLALLFCHPEVTKDFLYSRLYCWCSGDGLGKHALSPRVPKMQERIDGC